MIATVNANAPTASLPWSKKLLIAGLLCLEIPFGVVFFPLAAVLVLTGILAPLAIMAFKVATMPLSLSHKYKSQWRSGEELTRYEGGPQ